MERRRWKVARRVWARVYGRISGLGGAGERDAGAAAGVLVRPRGGCMPRGGCVT